MDSDEICDPTSTRLASLGVLLTAGLLTLIGVGALMAQGKWQVGLLAQVLFGLLLQGFGLVPIAHRLGLVLPSEELEPI